MVPLESDLLSPSNFFGSLESELLRRSREAQWSLKLMSSKASEHSLLFWLVLGEGIFYTFFFSLYILPIATCHVLREMNYMYKRFILRNVRKSISINSTNWAALSSSRSWAKYTKWGHMFTNVQRWSFPTTIATQAFNRKHTEVSLEYSHRSLNAILA